jgi:hypothetical protein
MTDAHAGDAALIEQSKAARTPSERADVFGFDLEPIARAAGRLRIASTAALVVGVVVIWLVVLGSTPVVLGSAIVGALLGFVAPVATFVIAQVIVRLFSRAGTSALTIASAPATQVITSLLMFGALLLTPHDASGFAGLLVGTWASASIEAGGHVATARAFDRHNDHLPRTARIWNDYPRWASLAFGQWIWVFLFSVISGLTAVGALLAFRTGTVAVALVILGLALASAIEAWATTRGMLWLRLLVSLAALAGVAAAWLLL